MANFKAPKINIPRRSWKDQIRDAIRKWLDQLKAFGKKAIETPFREAGKLVNKITGRGNAINMPRF